MSETPSAQLIQVIAVIATVAVLAVGVKVTTDSIKRQK